MSDDIELGRADFGFSYRIWFMGMRALLLGNMGRLDDARREMAQALRAARDSGIPENLGWTFASDTFLEAGVEHRKMLFRQPPVND